MPDQNDQAGAKQKTKPRRLLNPRRVQSLLYGIEQAMLKDRKEAKLTTAEKLAYVSAGAKYAAILSEAQKRQDNKTTKADKDSKAGESGMDAIFGGRIRVKDSN